MPSRFAPPTRSQLYVPADRPSWYAKAIAAGPDALILDLEDAVSPASKAAAREAAVSFLAEEGQRPTILVRVNHSESEHFLDDVLATVEAGVDGILLPKVSAPEDVVALAGLIDAIERRAGIDPGRTLICPLLETAAGIRDCYRIARASDRVAYLGALTIKGGDIERGIGFRWSPEGAETVAFRASVLLDARAAGVPCPTTGVWGDIDDLEGLQRFAEQGRSLGYEGMAVIHPAHVAIVNSVFAPSADELARDRRLIEAMQEGEQAGVASIRFEGEMVDIAMARQAGARVQRAQELELDQGKKKAG
jgi:citrate lyase subunit beta/citryl-CoA lyase